MKILAFFFMCYAVIVTVFRDVVTLVDLNPEGLE